MKLTNKVLEHIEELGCIDMSLINNFTEFTKELEKNGYTWELSNDTNKLLIYKEDK